MATADPAAKAAHPAQIVTARPLAVVGAGEHALVVAEAVRSRPGAWRIVGFADAAERDLPAARDPDFRYLGDDETLRQLLASDRDGGPALVLGFGGGVQPADRAATVEGFGDGVEWVTIVHVAAWVSPAAALGPGTFVGAAAVVQPGAVAGRHVIVNTGAIVEHDVLLGDYSHVGPGAAIGGGASVGRGTFVGLGARVRDHVTIGDGARIGMGAVVVGDVAAGETVAGVPARAVR